MPDAMSWLGMRIDDAYGARVGDVEDVYLETDGTPRWIFARPGRVLIPAEEAMAGAGRVWVPYEKELIRGAPAVTSLDQVTPEHEVMVNGDAHGVHRTFVYAAFLAFSLPAGSKSAL